MAHRRVVRTAALAALVLTWGCEAAEEPAPPLPAAAGEACATTEDCAAGLECVALTCMAVTPKPGDASTADAGPTADAAGPADTAAPPDAPDTAEPDAGPPARTSDPDDLDDATPAISGRVLYSADGTPIRDALVKGSPGLGEVLTNADGQYLFVGTEAAPITEGVLYQLRASRAEFEDGSVTITAGPGHNKDVDIVLDPVVPDLPLGANPSALTFELSSFGGSSTAIKQLVLFLNPAMPGLGSMGFTVSIPPHDAAWLSVKPETGKVGKTPFSLIVTVDRSGLGGGITGTFDVVPDDGDRLSIPVTVK